MVVWIYNQGGEDMSMTKRWLEDLSVEMGFGGEITDEVMARAEEVQAGAIDRAVDERRGC
jgi:hypothetical protein